MISAPVPAGAVEARVALVFDQSGFDPGSIYLDDVDFFVVPETMQPQQNKLQDGLVAAGQLQDVYASDNVDYELAPAPTSNPVKQKIDLILLAETSIDWPVPWSDRLTTGYNSDGGGTCPCRSNFNCRPRNNG